MIGFSESFTKDWYNNGYEFAAYGVARLALARFSIDVALRNGPRLLKACKTRHTELYAAKWGTSM